MQKQFSFEGINEAHRRTPNFNADQYRQKMRQTMKAHASTHQQREMARQKALQGYTHIPQNIKSQFEQSKSWKDVMQLHKRLHPHYPQSLILQFMRIYHKEAIELQQAGRLKANLYYMIQSP